MPSLFIYTDGGSRGNPGEAAVGAVVKDENKQILKQISRRIGQTTNNVAEYTAVVVALEWVKESVTMQQFNNLTMVRLFLDSKLVVNQLNGLFKMKDAKLRMLLLKARELEQAIGIPIVYSLIPREQNWEADRLVNKALDQK